jgi:hypothetical protein
MDKKIANVNLDFDQQREDEIERKKCVLERKR